MKAIRECPHCGGRAEKGYLGKKYFVYCIDCKCSTGLHDAIETAIGIWNSRYEPRTPGGPVVPAGNYRLRR